MNNSILKKKFIDETYENLNSIKRDLEDLETLSSNKNILNSIFRSVHTIKGSAGFIGYIKLQDLTHLL